jgi:SAM-dependent methyltransferase
LEGILGKAHRYYVNVKVKRVQKFLKELNPSEAICLDVGCGTGLAEHLFGVKAQGIVGVDTAASALSVANDRCSYADFIHGDALELPFANNSFDLAFAFSLMHHLDESQRLEALKEIARVTKVGGYMLTFEHNPSNPVTRHLVRSCPVDKDAVLIRPKDMIRLHRNTGLQLINLNYVIFFPSVLSFLEPLEPLLYWLPAGGQYWILARKNSVYPENA